MGNTANQISLGQVKCRALKCVKVPGKIGGQRQPNESFPVGWGRTIFWLLWGYVQGYTQTETVSAARLYYCCIFGFRVRESRGGEPPWQS